MNAIKNSNIKNGYIVLQGDEQGPAVATGTTVTSANSSTVLGDVKPGANVMLLRMPNKNFVNKLSLIFRVTTI